MPRLDPGLLNPGPENQGARGGGLGEPRLRNPAAMTARVPPRLVLRGCRPLPLHRAPPVSNQVGRYIIKGRPLGGADLLGGHGLSISGLRFDVIKGRAANAHTHVPNAQAVNKARK